MNCGIPLCIYIVEGTSFSVPQQHTHIKSGAIHSAIVSTHIECGMHVIRTRGIDHTVSTLCAMFNRISHRFRRGKCGTKFFKFEDFQKRCGKKQVENTGELFARMMKQVPGCSSASALALQDRFGTFANILKYCLETDACIAKVNMSRFLILLMS
jgi:ERCC4-type nuclease